MKGKPETVFYELDTILEAIHAYRTKTKTLEAIAEDLGCTLMTIGKWIYRYNHKENHWINDGKGNSGFVNLREAYDEKYLLQIQITLSAENPFKASAIAWETLHEIESRIDAKKAEHTQELEGLEAELETAREVLAKESSQL